LKTGMEQSIVGSNPTSSARLMVNCERLMIHCEWSEPEPLTLKLLTIHH
jgi:hypothetical protein